MKCCHIFVKQITIKKTNIMNISNIDTKGLLNLNTKDSLNFLNTLLTNKNFSAVEKVFTGLSTVIKDKNFPLMDNITLLVQTFNGTEGDGYWKLIS